MEEENKEIEITPSQYFDYIKGAKKTITTDALKNSYEVFVKLAEKYNKLGQKESLKKLCFLANTLIKEEKLIELGITTYIYKDVIEDYIETVAAKTVKIIELSRYTREIPDELVETVEKTKPLFNEFYVVFTDYTGKEERKVEKERRDKDPILFGVFKDNDNVADRFYFLGDWVDEFCDLTLDKLVEEYKNVKGYSPTLTSEIPTSSEDLLSLLKSYTIKEDTKMSANGNVINGSVSLDYKNVVLPVGNYKRNTGKIKESFFDKIRSILKK